MGAEANFTWSCLYHFYYHLSSTMYTGTGATTLPHSALRKVRRAVAKQYPWLPKVDESMLITDATKPDNPIVFANDKFERMTLYPAEHILGRNCRFLQGKYTDRATVKKLRQAIDAAHSIEVELLNYRKDGVAFWNRFVTLPVFGRSKKVTHFIAIQKNVSPLKDYSEENIKSWNPVQCAQWAEQYWKDGHKMVDKSIDGVKLMEMSESDLIALGVPKSNAKRILRELRKEKKKKAKPTEEILDTISTKAKLPDFWDTVPYVSDETFRDICVKLRCAGRDPIMRIVPVEIQLEEMLKMVKNCYDPSKSYVMLAEVGAQNSSPKTKKYKTKPIVEIKLATQDALSDVLAMVQKNRRKLNNSC